MKGLPLLLLAFSLALAQSPVTCCELYRLRINAENESLGTDYNVCTYTLMLMVMPFYLCYFIVVPLVYVSLKDPVFGCELCMFFFQLCRFLCTGSLAGLLFTTP